MNSFPFISHHLFVAAAGREGRPARKPARRHIPPAQPQGTARQITFELLEEQASLAAAQARPLQVSMALGVE
jgi:hypothetical protein